MPPVPFAGRLVVDAAHRAISGTTLIDNASDSSTATDRLSDSARKNCPGTPDSSPSGANTTTVVSVELTSGAISCCTALMTLLAAFAGAAMNVLDDDHRIVDHEADGDGQAAERHQVDRPAEQPHEDERRNDRHRQRDRGNHRQPPVAKEDEQDDDREEAADEDGVADAGDRFLDELGEVVDPADPDAGGQRRSRAASVASTPAFRSRMLAPICCAMLTETASRPLPVTSSVRSGDPASADVRGRDRRAALAIRYQPVM